MGWHRTRLLVGGSRHPLRNARQQAHSARTPRVAVMCRLAGQGFLRGSGLRRCRCIRLQQSWSLLLEDAGVLHSALLSTWSPSPDRRTIQAQCDPTPDFAWPGLRGVRRLPVCQCPMRALQQSAHAEPDPRGPCSRCCSTQATSAWVGASTGRMQRCPTSRTAALAPSSSWSCGTGASAASSPARATGAAVWPGLPSLEHWMPSAPPAVGWSRPTRSRSRAGPRSVVPFPDRTRDPVRGLRFHP